MGRHDAVAGLLLDNGANVNAKDNMRQTPLLLSSKARHNGIVLKLLPIKSIDLDLNDRYGSTAVSITARYGHVEVVKLLLDTEHVNIDSLDYFGRTPLWYAVRSGESDIARLLCGYAEKSGTSLCRGNLPPGPVRDLTVLHPDGAIYVL